METSTSEGSRQSDCPSSYYQHKLSLSLIEDQIWYCHNIFRDEAIFRLVPVRMIIGSNASLRNQSIILGFLLAGRGPVKPKNSSVCEFVMKQTQKLYTPAHGLSVQPTFKSSIASHSQYHPILIFISHIGCHPNENLTFEQQLHKRLFNSTYYSTDLLPRTSHSAAIDVSFGFELVKIVEVVSSISITTFCLIWRVVSERRRLP